MKLIAAGHRVSRMNRGGPWKMFRHVISNGLGARDHDIGRGGDF